MLYFSYDGSIHGDWVANYVSFLRILSVARYEPR